MYRRVFAAGLLAAVAALSGCGPKLVPAGGTVTLDGTPVEGAMVTFVAEDGGATYTGQSDAGGAFTLSSGAEPGAMPGKYKVLVTKTAAMSGGEGGGMTPDNPDYGKMMQRMKDENTAAAKAANKANAPKTGPMSGQKGMPGVAAPPMMMPGGGPGGPGGAPPPKTDLPVKYAKADSTDLTATVEAGGSKGIELKLTTPAAPAKK